MPQEENEVELSELYELEEQIEDLKDALYDERKQLAEEAYRLIRKKARNMVEPVDDATLGSYVRGVVDLQTELYNLSENAESEENGRGR